MPKTPKPTFQEVRETPVPAMKVWRLPDTDRAKTMCARASFYRLCQHDHHDAAWNGSRRDPGVGYLRERMEPAGFVPTNASASAPWGRRKPDTPHGLPKQIVERFTDMLLGHQGRPTLTVPADFDTAAYVEAVMLSSKSWASLAQARDLKGARGSAAFVPSVIDGVPTSEALCTEHLWPLEWANKADWVPLRILEQKLIDKQVVNEDGKLEKKRYWRTRYWDDEVAISYEDVPEDWDKEDPEKEIPLEEIVEHKLSRCPVVWMQNTRDTDSPEGREDMAGTYAQSDKLDTVRSFGTRSTIANTDPTLLIKDEEQRLRRNQMREKGHGKKIEVGPQGDASLLETSGAAVKSAWDTAGELRHDILQTTGCMIPDPDVVGGAKLSGEALTLLWRAMENKCDRYRVPLEDEVRQVAMLWIEIGAAFGVSSVEDDPEDEKTGVILPPRETPELDGDGKAKKDDDGKPVVRLETHEVGKGRWVKVTWGPYHRLSPLQVQALVAALVTANGTKAVISQETATTLIVNALSLGSPSEEMARIEAEKAAGMELMEGMGDQFGGIGGDDDPVGTKKDQDDDAKAETDAAKDDKAKTTKAAEPKNKPDGDQT